MQDAHHAEDVEKTDNYRDEVLARLTKLEALLRDSQGHDPKS
jgi:voltage-gated sodium channel